MNGSIRWLIRDVFLRARASGFTALLIGISAITGLACLTVRPDASTGNLGFWFGKIPAGNDPHQLLFWLACGVADVGGVLVALLAMAGFVPTFLESSVAKVPLSKPPQRSLLLFGRCLGVVLFLALHAGLFLSVSGVALGIATGEWVAGYWLAWPLLMAQFLPFFAFSVLIAVNTRSTAAAMLGSVFFWAVSWGMNFGRHFLAGLTIDGATQPFSRGVEWCYQILPRPADLSLILYRALDAQPEGLPGAGLRSVQQLGLYSPTAAVVSSVVIAVVLFGLSVFELNHQDY